MKKNLILTFSVVLALAFTACNKENNISKDTDFKDAVSLDEADIVLDAGKYEKIITNPLVKTDDCQYIVSGTIEFWQEGTLKATIDFGDGTCDNIATKTIGDEVKEFFLKKKPGKYGKYDKLIVEPLVKTDDCEYIVSGIIQFVLGDEVAATIDFGDGECDEWATKYWDGGNKVFSLKKGKD